MRVCMIVRTLRATREEHAPPEHTPPEHAPPAKRGTQDQDQHTTGHCRTRNTTGKERDTDNTGKPAYIGMIAGNEKSIKKVKKNLEI